jgi:sugar-phosphatase
VTKNRGRRFLAAIFDLDGLLIDSEPLWQQAEIEGFGAVGARLTRQQARETLGLRSDDVVRLRYEQFGWDIERHPLEQVEEGIIRRVIELIGQVRQPMSGVYRALDFVESKGLRLALASSSRRAIIEAALAALGLSDRFEVTYSAETEPLGKPHPGVYLATARALDVPPGSCIAFEDSIAGVESARAAGMICVGVPDQENLGDLKLDRADLILASLAELDEETWQLLESAADLRGTR